MLSLINLKKSFDSKPILKDINFDAQNGLLTVIEGQNGAGKSTLFNIITGLLHQDAGEIILNQVSLSHLSAIERAPYMAILKQDPKASSVESLSVMENMALALLKDRKAALKNALSVNAKQRIRDHLVYLGLGLAIDLNLPMSHLSGGQRQLIAFAMAVLTKPQILLLDEPTAALDENSGQSLMQLVKRLIKEWQIPAVMICHDRKLNREYADKILILENGSIIPSLVIN